MCVCKCVHNSVCVHMPLTAHIICIVKQFTFFTSSHSNYSPSACASFHSIAVEVGVGQGEVFSIGTQQLGEDGLLLIALHVLVDVAVHEAVHQRRVGMEVDVEIHLIFL